MISALIAALGCAAGAPVGLEGTPQERPNLVLIVADDLGRGWLSCYGSETVETPRIDALAAEGTRFERIASMPICTPSRVTLLTGQYPFRHGWSDHWDVPRWGSGCHFDPAEYACFARVLRDAGYATAIAGKWQVNDFRVQPDVLAAHGFERWCVWTGFETGNAPSKERYWDPYVHTNDGRGTRAGSFGADVFVDFGLEFLTTEREAPALLYLPLCLPHGPNVATPAEPEVEGEAERYAAMVRYVDVSVGRIVDALETAGLLDETIVMFTTDNGSPRGQEARVGGVSVHGGKGQLTEAGIAVPFVARGPGIAQGVVSPALADFSDVFPTVLELAGVELQSDHTIDGISLAPVLRGEAEASPRAWTLSMGGKFARGTAAGVVPRKAWADRALFDGRHKLLLADHEPIALFDIASDPLETSDLLASEDPAHVAARVRLLEVAHAFPVEDASPRYAPTPPQAWDSPPRGLQPDEEAQPARPNVLLLMADDQGWGDVGFRGHPRLETPHLDAMAADGIVLDRFYSAAPVCSPTRASVLTGRHPMRLGIPGANAGHLPRGETTVAELLKPLGYRTGFFGKWHLGTLSNAVRDSNRGGIESQAQHFTTPDEHGFDSWFATEAKVPTWDPMWAPGTREPYGTAYWNGDDGPVERNLDGDDSRVIVDRVEPFVRAAVAADEPFLAVVWFHAPHLPVVAGPDMQARYADVEDEETRAYYGCVSALDAEVGRLRALVRELGVEDDTLVWYASDNGPEGQAGKAPGSSGPLRGRKRSLLEGGVRVPGIVEWPARIPRGSTSVVPCVTSDILPTIAAIVGATPPRDRTHDGIDLARVLWGAATERGSAIGFWSGRRAAWTADRWKLLSADDGASWSLCDLATDVGEETDLAAEHPELAESMAAEFQVWREGVRGDGRTR